LLSPPDRGPATAEQVARVASARREPMLRAHGFRLRREDLEDCYSQAVLELLMQASRGRTWADNRHIANALEQRLLSRIQDRRRALAGRSPMEAALAGARPLGHGQGEVDVADHRAGVEELVLLRAELRAIWRLSGSLTRDQRLVLATQLLRMPRADFCSRFGWSGEKYRKVAQRARARLRALIESEGGDVPPATRASEGKQARP
jgi:hypothetical protein